jgi:hypothetical protein
MSKKAKVGMADFLLGAGFNPRKTLKVCGIPFLNELQVTASAVDEHKVFLVDEFENNRFEIKKGFKTFNSKTAPMPFSAHVESYPVNNKSGDWSISRSEMQTKHSKSVQKFYFGNASSGSSTDSAIPIIHRISIPWPNGWPVSKYYKPKYPPLES